MAVLLLLSGNQLVNAQTNSHDKPPLVFVHGWRGLDDTAPCTPGVPDTSNFPDGYWIHLDQDMQALGFDVTYAKLISGSGLGAAADPDDCTPVAQANVPYVMQAIDTALANNPTQDKVILISHSMGGLVSRAYLESAMYRDDVVELYTLGTPHLGVPVDGLAGIIEFFTLGIVNLEDACDTQPVVCQFSDDEAQNPPDQNGVTRPGIETFHNTFNTRPEKVHYHLIGGGDVAFGDRSNLGAIMAGFITGSDDGIVPQDSAVGDISNSGLVGPVTGTYDRNYTYELHIEDFADSANWPFNGQQKFTYFTQDAYNGVFGGGEVLAQELVSETYLDCLFPVISDRQNDHVCDTGAVGTYSPEMTIPDMDGIAPRHNGSLSAGETIRRTLSIPDGPAMFAAVVEDGSGLSFDVLDVNGDLVETAFSKLDAKSAVIYLPNARAGTYTLLVSAESATSFATMATFSTQATTQVSFDQAVYAPGQLGTITVTTTDMGRATITTEIAGETIGLNPAGDGVYVGTFTAPQKTGYVSAPISISFQDASGVQVEMSEQHMIGVVGNHVSLTGRFVDSVQPALNAKTKTNDLVISAEMTVKQAGLYGISADLVNQRGDLIASSTIFGDLTSGIDTLDLRFRGHDLIGKGADGVLSLANIRLIDYSVGGIVTQMIERAHNTTPVNRSMLTAQRSLPHLAVSAREFLIDESVHTCDVTPSNSGQYLSVGDNFQFDFSINLDSTHGADFYTEWMDYYYTTGPAGWAISAQSTAPANVGGWPMAMTQTFDNGSGLAYWGYDYTNLTDLDLANSVLPDEGTFCGPWQPDTGTPHDFSITYAVPTDQPSCPGSAYIGIPTDGESVMGVAIGDLIDHGINEQSCTFGGYMCPLPEITMSKTVSTNGQCPGTASTTVPFENQTVTFCFEVTNTSTEAVTLTDYVIDDPNIGLMNVSATSQTIAPGETAIVYQTDYTYSGSAGQCFNNGATITASTAEGFGQPQSQTNADAPYLTTTYTTTASTADDATEVCILVPLSVEMSEMGQVEKTSTAILIAFSLGILLTGASYFVARRNN